MITSKIVRANSPPNMGRQSKRPSPPVNQIPPTSKANIGMSSVNYPSIARNLYPSKAGYENKARSAQ